MAKVQLTGGEPLLYPNFENILLEYGDNYEFVITTSAYHIKDSTLNALKKAKLVQVSLYSFNTTQTDIFMKNPGACQNIVQNIRRLLDTGIRVRVSNMVTPENVDNIQEFIEECIKLGVKEVTFGKVASIGNAANHPELLLNSYQFQKACDILRQMEQVYGKLIKIDTWDECPVQEMKGSIFTCDAGTMSWTVLENGDIQPCSLVNDTKLRMGSIYDEQSTNLSNSKEIKKLHARWSSYDEIVQWHSMLKRMSMGSKHNSLSIKKHVAQEMANFFNVACEKLGFVDAYNILRRLNSSYPEGIEDIDMIAYDYIDNLKFYDSLNKHTRNIPTIVKLILESSNIAEETKVVFVSKYLQAIVSNPYFSKEIRTDLLDKFFVPLGFVYKQHQGDLKKKIYLEIVRNHVLLNENQLRREEIFASLIKILRRYNQYSDDECFVSILAEILRAFYFYIYLEQETFSEEYMEELYSLFQYEVRGKDRIPVSFRNLLLDNWERVVEQLAIDSLIFEERSHVLWNYFSPNSGFKRIVWCRENLVKFAFAVNKSVGQNITPFCKLIDSENYNPTHKLEVCDILQSLYHDGMVTEDIREMVKDIRSLCCIKDSNWPRYSKIEYDFFQGKSIQLEEIFSESKNVDQVKEQIENKVNQCFGENSVFEFRKNMKSGQKSNMQLVPRLVLCNESLASNSFYRIKHYLVKILNENIRQILKPIVLNFKQDGIESLYDRLKNCNFQYRNYTYVDDWAFDPNVKSLTIFNELQETIKSIHLDTQSDILSKVFLTKPTVQYNVEFSYSLDTPKEEDIKMYISQNKVAEGVYRINSKTYDYSHALQYVQKYYKVEMISMEVYIQLEENDGFTIDFDRN